MNKFKIAVILVMLFFVVGQKCELGKLGKDKKDIVEDDFNGVKGMVLSFVDGFPPEEVWKEVDFGINESGNSLELLFDKRLIGKIASVYVEDNFLFSATIGKKDRIKVTKDSDVGKEMLKAIHGRKQMRVLI